MADFLDPTSWDWNKIVQPAVEGVARGVVPAIFTAAGGRQATAANARAAEIAGEGARAALARNDAAIPGAIQAVQGGNAAARARLQASKTRNLDMAAPAASYLRSVVARNPYQLTPQQEQLVAQQRTSMINNMDPSIRGSGVAYTAAAGQMANNLEVPLINQNVQRADAAARDLNAPAQGAANAADTNIANVDAGEGNTVANLTTGSAGRAGQIIQGGADTQANAATATGSTNANTMGAIGSFFANAANNAARESRYGKFSYAK